jgi:hypothetical protein
MKWATVAQDACTDAPSSGVSPALRRLARQTRTIVVCDTVTVSGPVAQLVRAGDS